MATLQRSHSLQVEDEKEALPRQCVWDWPFCEEGVAKCDVTKEKFTVCLEFTCAKGESYISVCLTGSLVMLMRMKIQAKKFEQIKDSNFSWSLGLSSVDGNTCFYRLEIEILRNLNMIVIEAFRDISRLNEPGKTLRRVRKVYRLPDEFDIATLQTGSFSAGTITLVVFRRAVKSHAAQRRLVNGHLLKRSGSAVAGDP
jgi:hypothetical protein